MLISKKKEDEKEPDLLKVMEEQLITKHQILARPKENKKDKEEKKKKKDKKY